MKFRCGPTPQERHEAKQQWHRFFALWPRRVASNDCRWLEYIERKGKYTAPCFVPRFSGWTWEYREQPRPGEEKQ